MNYVTRANIHVDRAASAWLIRRFVDPDAEFLFIEDPDDLPLGAIPFDMIGVELSHRADRVTFETILAVHDLDEPALVRLGQIIHQADVADDLHDAPEAAGLDAVIRGLSILRSDHEVLDVSFQLFDGLYDWLRSANT